MYHVIQYYCDYMNELINNIDRIHTTYLGNVRIRKVIEVDDVIGYIRDIIKNKNFICYKRGKNYYIEYNDIIITINSYSYTVITVHSKYNKYVKIERK